MHSEALDFIKTMKKALLLEPKLVIEFGSRDVNGSPRSLFNDSTYIGVDIQPGKGVDVVCDAALYKSQKLADLVISAETLEHAENWKGIIENAASLLKEGGALIITAASPLRIPHGCDGGDVGNEYYQGIKETELKEQLDKCFNDSLIQLNDHGDIDAFAVKRSNGRRLTN